MDIILEEKSVNFHKILLNREEKHSMRICNRCNVPGYWRLKIIEKLNFQISISPNMGWIQSKETVIIDILLKASKV